MTTGYLVAVVGFVAAAGAVFAETDPLSGGAGWIGAGLLGLVLAWLLLKHLPDKDSQIERLIVRADERADKMAADYEKSLTMVMDRQDKQNAELIKAMRDEFAKFAPEGHRT